MRCFGGCALVAVLICASGCARARITTNIQKDGTWVRTLTFTGQEKKENSAQMGPSVQDVFAIPSGAGWKKTQETKKDDLAITVERTLQPGASLDGDLTTKDDKDPAKLHLVNQVTVTRLGPKRFEYRETLKWKGSAAQMLGDIKADDLAKIKAELPKAVATDDNARALARRVEELAIPMMFGPGDPLLSLGLMHPDLAERRATQRMGNLLVQALEQQFGDKMQPAERKEVARRIITGTFSTMKPSQPDPAAGPPTDKGSGLTPLMFVLKTSGKIVSSNGELDDFTGEVFWAMFEEAAAFKDLVLSAIIEQ